MKSKISEKSKSYFIQLKTCFEEKSLFLKISPPEAPPPTPIYLVL